MTLVHGRFAAVSVRAALLAGTWVGFVMGIVIGALLGGLLVWFAGAVLDWQRDLAFTLGITRSLLPFGDQIAIFRWLSGSWWIVVPVTALAVAVVGAGIGAAIGSLLAAAYNLSPRHAGVILEVDPLDAPAATEEPAP